MVTCIVGLNACAVKCFVSKILQAFETKTICLDNVMFSASSAITLYSNNGRDTGCTSTSRSFFSVENKATCWLIHDRLIFNWRSANIFNYVSTMTRLRDTLGTRESEMKQTTSACRNSRVKQQFEISVYTGSQYPRSPTRWPVTGNKVEIRETVYAFPVVNRCGG